MRRTSQHLGAVVVAQRSGEDLTRTGRLLVHQHHQRPAEKGAGRGREGKQRIVGRSAGLEFGSSQRSFQLGGR